MDKIKFGAKKSKVKTFGDEPAASKQEQAQTQIVHVQSTSAGNSPKEQTKIYKNTAQVFAELKTDLTERFNIDDISVYQLSLSKEYNFVYHKIYGTDISRCALEKYYSFDQPLILTNADGFADNSSHRARLIERYGVFTVIVSSSAFEAFKQASELEDVRKTIKSAYKEVKKLL